MKPLLNKLWRLFTEPSERLTLPQNRQQARLLAALLGSQILVALAIGLPLAVLSESFRARLPLLQMAFIATVLAYLLSRARYFQWGALVYITTMFSVVFGLLLFDPDAAPDRVLPFLILPVLVTSLLFSTEATLLAALSAGVGVLLIPLMSQRMPMDSALLSVMLLAFASLLIVVAHILREQEQIKLDQRTRALVESEARYHSLFEASFEGVAIYENGLLRDMNPAFERMFGYALEEALGKPALFFAPEDEHSLLLTKARSGDMVETFETIGLRKDGSTFPIEVMTRPHIYKGQPVRVAAIRDLSERQEAERQRVALAVEKERVAVLRRFISEASHDLRTPLTNLKASTYLLKRLTDNPQKQQEHLNVLEHQTARLERLLTDFLMMSRLDVAATGEFVFGAVAVRDVVDEVLAQQQNLITRKQHNLSVELAEDLRPVLVDRDKLVMALNQLLVNACNYTPSGGQITLRASLEGDDVAIAVQDNGIGIKPHQLPRVFDSFYRADEARSADTGGTGLGLAIAKRIIEMHGGQIAAASIPEEGSTFTIYLPALSEDVAQELRTRIEARPVATEP